MNMLSTLKDFLKLIRWFHALLALFPFVSIYLVIRYFESQKGLDSQLSSLEFILLCICVQAIMGSGFVLNDIIDRDTDAINKPKTRIVERKISLRNSWVIFISLSIIGAVLSIFIGWGIFWEWYVIAPIVYLLSICYNLYFKRMPLVGNFAIAALASSIPLVLLFYASEVLDNIDNDSLYSLIYFYAWLPFLIIVPRELSLDISDLEGDKRSKCITYPVKYGEQKARKLVNLMVWLIIIFFFLVGVLFPSLRMLMAILAAMLIIYLWLFKKAKTRIQLVQIGRYFWFIMLFGLAFYTIHVTWF